MAPIKLPKGLPGIAGPLASSLRLRRIQSHDGVGRIRISTSPACQASSGHSGAMPSPRAAPIDTAIVIRWRHIWNPPILEMSPCTGATGSSFSARFRLAHRHRSSRCCGHLVESVGSSRTPSGDLLESRKPPEPFTNVVPTSERLARRTGPGKRRSVDLVGGRAAQGFAQTLKGRRMRRPSLLSVEISATY